MDPTGLKHTHLHTVISLQLEDTFIEKSKTGVDITDKAAIFNELREDLSLHEIFVKLMMIFVS